MGNFGVQGERAPGRSKEQKQKQQRRQDKPTEALVRTCAHLSISIPPPILLPQHLFSFRRLNRRYLSRHNEYTRASQHGRAARPPQRLLRWKGRALQLCCDSFAPLTRSANRTKSADTIWTSPRNQRIPWKALGTLRLSMSVTCMPRSLVALLLRGPTNC